ncbi:hypothetical protein SDC9_185594 [bioreactor metagenome]|uniref:Uncharacterized protein n=1 Tax=bioreactor metagenome TaxID=1076179 RepID=A0A645HGD2_9ZZZZ
MENIFHLPVYCLANFIAFSLDSAPAFVKNTLAPSKPEASITALAASDLTSNAYPGPINGIFSACSFIAVTMALFPCPRLEFTSCDDMS